MYDLGAQFVFDKEKAISKEKAVFKGKKYRITVLTDKLLRIEYSEKGIFNDRPTQFALFRNFDVPYFNAKQDERYLDISTNYFNLTYVKDSDIKSTSNLRITLEGTDKVWYYTNPEVRNFNANMLNLDGKKILFQKGLFSTDGFASINDSNTFVVNDDGSLASRKEEVIDIYVFMYRNDFTSILKDYFLLTGIPPMLPRYAFGIWWSKDFKYNDDMINRLFIRFTKEEIPISVLLLDKDWHSREYNGRKELETGYSFNKELIKDPTVFIKNIHNRGIRIGLNVNPKEGILPNEVNYNEARKYINVLEGVPIKYAPYSPVFLDVYFKLLIHPLESIGIDFFWNDFHDDTNTNIYFANSHYGYLDSGRADIKRGMYIARNPMISSHRYGVLYSGKTKVGWNTLKLLPETYSSASNIGISWWSHDIGGFSGGIEDGELYTRYIQLGCFSPIFRIHVDKGRYYKREPWRWNVQTFEIVKEYMQLRNKLIPYIYSEAYRYHKDGLPIIQPLYYKNIEIYDDALFKNQYYFGKEFLICPITSKKDQIMNRVVHKFYLPKGTWYDFKTGKKFPGERSHVSFFKDEDYPVFVRSGAVIPMARSISNNPVSPTFLDINIFQGRSNVYELYEDDGTSNLYKKGDYLKTAIDYNYQENNYTVIIRAVEGKAGIIPDKRNYRIKFRNTRKTSDISINFDGTIMPFTSYEDERDFIIEVKDVNTIGQLTVICKGKAIEIDAVRLINEDIDEIISDLSIETSLKDEISSILFSNNTIKKKRISIRKLKKKGLEEKFIRMFIKLLEYIEQI